MCVKIEEPGCLFWRLWCTIKARELLVKLPKENEYVAHLPQKSNRAC